MFTSSKIVLMEGEKRNELIFQFLHEQIYKLGNMQSLWYTGEDRIEIDKIPRNLILSKAK